MADRHVETRAEGADLHRRGHDGARLAESLAHGIAARHVPQRAVLDLAFRPDDGALAVAVDRGTLAERADQAVGQHQAEGLQIVHGALQRRLVAPGEGVLHHGHRRRPPARPVGGGSALVEDLLDDETGLADRELRHGR